MRSVNVTDRIMSSCRESDAVSKFTDRESDAH